MHDSAPDPWWSFSSAPPTDPDANRQVVGWPRVNALGDEGRFGPNGADVLGLDSFPSAQTPAAVIAVV